jgi:hypothetical protein
MKTAKQQAIKQIDNAKNQFMNWLKANNAECIDEFKGNDNIGNWDYYNVVSGFVNDILYTVYFNIWNGKLRIDYSDEENRYSDMSIEEFLQLGCTNQSPQS